jgi:hypothetical protein
MIFCNLAVSKQKLRPSEQEEHRRPHLRKALAVVRYLKHGISISNILNSCILADFLTGVNDFTSILPLAGDWCTFGGTFHENPLNSG